MAFLTMLSGASTGAQHDLGRDETSIGRAPDCAVVLDDPAASSRHCVILRQGRQYKLRDLDSTNGTFLNGARVSEEWLKPKDKLTVGAVDLLFDGEDVELPEPAAVTAVQETVRLAEETEPAGAASPAPFEVRRSRKGVWFAVGFGIAAILVALLVWFVSSLLGG